MPVYELKHISDLLNVPAERRNAMLDEMKVALPFFNAQLIAALAHNPGTTPQDIMPRIIWEDNGELTVTARFGSGAVSVLTTKSASTDDDGPPCVGDLVQKVHDLWPHSQLVVAITGTPPQYIVADGRRYAADQLCVHERAGTFY